MSALQIQIMQSIIKLPEDKLPLVLERVQQLLAPIPETADAAGARIDAAASQTEGIKIGLFDGMKYIKDGHDIDECNADIAAMFGVDAG